MCSLVFGLFTSAASKWIRSNIELSSLKRPCLMCCFWSTCRCNLSLTSKSIVTLLLEVALDETLWYRLNRLFSVKELFSSKRNPSGVCWFLFIVVTRLFNFITSFCFRLLIHRYYHLPHFLLMGWNAFLISHSRTSKKDSLHWDSDPFHRRIVSYWTSNEVVIFSGFYHYDPSFLSSMFLLFFDFQPTIFPPSALGFDWLQLASLCLDFSGNDLGTSSLWSAS